MVNYQGEEIQDSAEEQPGPVTTPSQLSMIICQKSFSHSKWLWLASNRTRLRYSEGSKMSQQSSMIQIETNSPPILQKQHWILSRVMLSNFLLEGLDVRPPYDACVPRKWFLQFAFSLRHSNPRKHWSTTLGCQALVYEPNPMHTMRWRALFHALWIWIASRIFLESTRAKRYIEFAQNTSKFFRHVKTWVLRWHKFKHMTLFIHHIRPLPHRTLPPLRL